MFGDTINYTITNSTRLLIGEPSVQKHKERGEFCRSNLQLYLLWIYSVVYIFGVLVLENKISFTFVFVIWNKSMAVAGRTRRGRKGEPNVR